MKRVFVTVGTTKFPGLIDALMQPSTLQSLAQRGYTTVQIQTGRGYELPPLKDAIVQQQGPSRTVELADFGITMKFDEYFERFEEEIQKADLVISHAGAGSCLDVLRQKKPLIIVVNHDLMDNHQAELAKELHKNCHVYSCVPRTLHAAILCDMQQLVPYPKSYEKRFANYLDKCCGFVE